MDISFYLEFCEIARCGSLSEAARELHITQPALTRHVNTIEQEIGLKLLDRSTTPVQLTPAGEVFLDYAYNIRSVYSGLCNHMECLRKNEIRTIRIAGIYGPIMGRAVRSAKKKVETESFRLDFSQDVMSTWKPTPDLIREGKLDIGIETYSPLLDTDDLRSVSLVHEDAYLLMSVDNPLAEQKSFGIEDLNRIKFKYAKSNVHHAYVSHLRWLCQESLQQGVTAKSIVLANTTTMRGVLFSGLDEHAIMLPESMAKRYTSDEYPDFVRRPFEDEAARYDIRAFCSLDASDETIRFIELLGKELRASGFE